MNVKLPLTISTIISFCAMLVSLKVFVGSLPSEHALRTLLASVGLAIFSLMFLCCAVFLFKELFLSKKH